MTLAPMTTSQRRWVSYRDMADVDERFHHLVHAFFGDRMSPMALPVDVEETDDAYVVDIDLPNVDPDGLNLEIRGEELRLSGTHPERDRAGVVRRHSRPSGDFEYVVDVPGDIDPDNVEAIYDHGVLTIRVGKIPEAQPRRIEIQAP